MSDSIREDLRNAVAEAFDYAINDAVFDAANGIADAILDDEQIEASEIADGLVETYTSDLLNQWQGLQAQGAAANEGLAEPTTDALDLIRADVWTVLYNASQAALEAYESATV